MHETLDVVMVLVTGAALGASATSVAWWWDTAGRGRAFRRWLGRHGDFDATVPSGGAAFLAEAHRRRQDERAARLKEAAK
jgi:hypothetical protein